MENNRLVTDFYKNIKFNNYDMSYKDMSYYLFLMSKPLSVSDLAIMIKIADNYTSMYSSNQEGGIL